MSYRNGLAKIKDAAAFLSWYESLSVEAASQIHDHISTLRTKSNASNARDPVVSSSSLMYLVQGGYVVFGPYGSNWASKWDSQKHDRIRRIKRFLNLSLEHHQDIHVDFWEEGEYASLYIGNREALLVVPSPESYFTYEPEKNFAEMTPMEAKATLGAPLETRSGDLVPADIQNTMSVKSATDALNSQNEVIEQLNAEIEDIKAAKTDELAALQQQIEAMQNELEAKKEKLLAELGAKMLAMKVIKERMEMQIYLLDSQIYSIRCYCGDVVKFSHIRTGKNASENAPIVIHQKLHFLDEDLGRLASLYQIQWDDMDMFEEFLKHSELAFETFTPNPRCVSLVRLSRTGKQYGTNDANPYSNMLKDYKYFHGETIGILIRNGENLYLGWTDDTRVHIEDDLIINQIIPDEQSDDSAQEFTFPSERERYTREKKEKRKKMLDGIISRSFVYNILQGIVDNSTILSLPSGVTLGKESEYVKYSVADKWLTDNRFGSFTDIIERCNQTIRKGDALLTVQRLVPEREFSLMHGYRSQSWINVRGRGDRNRTHDAVVNDCTIYVANVVEYEEPVNMTRYRQFVKPDVWMLRKDKNAQPFWQERVVPTEQYEKTHNDGGSTIPENERDQIIEVFDYRKQHVFVSAVKQDNWTYSGEARANVEVFSEEIINLTYMNSVWLEWVITNKTLGNWRIGGQTVDYAYAIKYLKTAMDFVRKREEKEKAYIDDIDPAVCADADWPLLLSEWKLEKGVRKITPYQAKRFVNYLTVK